MSPKLQKIYLFLLVLESYYNHLHQKRPKGGRVNQYSHSSFIIFFMSMFTKKVFRFKTMERLAKKNYELYGFSKAPCRKTIRRRLIALPKVIVWFLPQIARYCYKNLSFKIFNIRWLYSDKSIFRAKGGLWHKSQKDAGIAPHPSVDTDASWAKSPYHQWRFGYGLIIICNQSRFPVAAMAETATMAEPAQLATLIKPIARYVGMIVGDAAYKVQSVITQLYNNQHILLLTKETFKDSSMQWYNDLVDNVWAKISYAKRKPSIEPVFALVKQIFDLEHENQLPYKGKHYVIPFLLVTTITVQLMSIYNFQNQIKFQQTHEFLSIL